MWASRWPKSRLRSGGRLFATSSGPSGEPPAEEAVLIVAHHDTVEGCPGADDNGSGVAGLLEIAKVLARYRHRRTVECIAFSLEEADCLGSCHFVKKARLAKRRIVAVLDLEMIGFTGPR